MEIGSAFPLDKPLTMEIEGRNLIEGVPKTITIDDSEISPCADKKSICGSCPKAANDGKSEIRMGGREVFTPIFGSRLARYLGPSGPDQAGSASALPPRLGLPRPDKPRSLWDGP